MNKMGNPMGNFYRYQLRFCALIGPHPHKLCAWKEETRYRRKQVPDNVIHLEGCSLSCAKKQTGNSNSFGIFHPNRKEVYLLCPDRQQYLQWMQALEGVLINPQQLRIEDFELISMVGRGSFGQVFQVRKKDTNAIYALKVLEKSFVRKRDQVQNTKAERRVLEIVNHPFIVTLYYAFQTGSTLCLVMDFINGGELFIHLKKQKFFSERDARIWAAEILLALEYLHSMGIIYRDIKPENVLLDKGGHIKLTDFGLARDVTDAATAKTVAGSPYYMAPEVLLMQGHDVQADWWSLGILIYEMLVGLPPFYSSNAKAAYQRLLTEPIPFPDHVSESARILIRGLLKTNPAHRLGAIHRPKGKKSSVAEPVGDAMQIKTQAWFQGMRWEHVLMRQLRPSIVPELKDDLDISNFDQTFTSDLSWKNSKLLKSSSQANLDDLDEFGSDFNYIARPSMDLNSTNFQQRSPGIASRLLRDISGPPTFNLQGSSEALRNFSLDLSDAIRDESVETLAPWQPHKTEDVHAVSQDESMHGMSTGEPLRAASNYVHSSYLDEEQLQGLLVKIPFAKEGYLESTKKGTVMGGRTKYLAPKKKYLRLVPSLGACLIFRTETSLVPIGVLPLPHARKIYPKHGVIPINNKVYVYSIRILVNSKEYTFICESQAVRDDWVQQLRIVGERWRYSPKPNQQVVGPEKLPKQKSGGLFGMFSSVSHAFEPNDRFQWQAILADGSTIDMLSEFGEGSDGKWRYDGQIQAEDGKAGGGLRHHGRGVCVWKARSLIYDGEWHRGSRQGQAMVKYPDGSLYEGGYKSSSGKQGHGRLEYANGSWYQGGWVADKRHGFGYIFWSTNGEAHQGMFENDVPHGKGARYYPSGEVYMGGWQKGEKHGVGVLEGPHDESEEAEKQSKVQEGAVASGAMKRIKSHACIDGLPLDNVDLRSSDDEGSDEGENDEMADAEWEDADDEENLQALRRFESDLEEVTESFYSNDGDRSPEKCRSAGSSPQTSPSIKTLDFRRTRSDSPPMLDYNKGL